MKSVFKYFLFSLLLIAIDQAIKYWVYKHMLPGYQGQINVIGEFFKLHYVTNRGMAFGMELPFANGKIVLTVFRLVAMVLIGLYLNHLYQKKYPAGLLWSVAAILGGAIGNLIDSIFYGVLINNAPFDAPYRWFHGQVIDMFFFDIYEGVLPNWIPIIGGAWYSTPIFNFADACIFCGVVSILFFQKSFFIDEEEQKTVGEEQAEILSEENNSSEIIADETLESTDEIEVKSIDNQEDIVNHKNENKSDDKEN